jgi:hypothetical protein
MGWSTHKIVPASCQRLDFHEIETELIRNDGNVTATAKALGVPSADLRKLVWSTKLADTVYEVAEGKLDEAQQVVLDALSGADKTHRLQAAKIWLTQTIAGKRRGWGSGSAIELDGVDEAEPTTTIKWLEN